MATLYNNKTIIINNETSSSEILVAFIDLCESIFAERCNRLTQINMPVKEGGEGANRDKYNVACTTKIIELNLACKARVYINLVNRFKVQLFAGSANEQFLIPPLYRVIPPPDVYAPSLKYFHPRLLPSFLFSLEIWHFSRINELKSRLGAMASKLDY